MKILVDCRCLTRTLAGTLRSYVWLGEYSKTDRLRTVVINLLGHLKKGLKLNLDDKHTHLVQKEIKVCGQRYSLS